jgi:hypothetical protein
MIKNLEEGLDEVDIRYSNLRLIDSLISFFNESGAEQKLVASLKPIKTAMMAPEISPNIFSDLIKGKIAFYSKPVGIFSKEYYYFNINDTTLSNPPYITKKTRRSNQVFDVRDYINLDSLPV